MSRWWVSWWSGYYDDEGCTEPPFQVWITGSRDRDETRNEVSLCAVIDADSEAVIWDSVLEHFPDYVGRFCEPVDPDWIPGDRFRDYQGRTALHVQ